MAKPFFKPIDIGGNIVFYDWRYPAQMPGPRDECNAILLNEFRAQVEVVAKSSVSPPGCHHMWHKQDTDDFIKQLDHPMGFKYLSEYRKSLRVHRSEEGLDGTSRTLLAWQGAKPLGGVVLYNDEVLSVRAGVIAFVSHIGPFTQVPKTSADLMNHLLENNVNAIDQDGSAVVARLVEWQFPAAEQNRWRSNLATFNQWHGLLGKHTSISVFDATKDYSYRVSYRLSPDRDRR